MVHKCLSEDKTEKSAAPVRRQEVEEWEDCANPETQVWKSSYCLHLSCPFWIPNVSEKKDGPSPAQVYFCHACLDA